MFNFWWLAEWSEQITLTKRHKNEKGPLSHRKIKCLFLDYVQLLMIGWVIWAKNVDQNAKKWKGPPKSSKNKMFNFGLRSTSDDRPSNLSKKCWRKHKKMKIPLSHRKIKCLFLDYVQLLRIGRTIWAKNVDRNAKKWKRPPKSSKNKMFVLDYVQLLMIGRVIWAKNIDQNRKKWKRPPKSSKNKMFVFGLHSTSEDRPSDLSKKCWPKGINMIKAP